MNLGACTLPGALYPAYVSVNTKSELSKDVTITVRGAAVDGREGPQAEITLPREELTRLATEMLKGAEAL